MFYVNLQLFDVQILEWPNIFRLKDILIIKEEALILSEISLFKESCNNNSGQS